MFACPVPGSVLLGFCFVVVTAGCGESTPTHPAGAGATGSGATGAGANGATGTAMQTCAAGQIECAGVCVDATANPLHCGACTTACAVGQTCVSGQCACPAGTLLCGAACIDVTQDANNCGACNNVCSIGAVCQASQCLCSGGLTDCSGACVNLQGDGNNCGTCGTVCPHDRSAPPGSVRPAARFPVNRCAATAA